jgi:TonB family protein
MTKIPLANGRLAALALSLAALAAAPAHAQKIPSPYEPVDPQLVWSFDQVTEQARLANPNAVAQMLSRGYPRRLLDSGVRGSATLEVIVDPRGRVEQVSVVDASHAAFAAAARDAASALRFRPAKVLGVPVRSRFTIPVSFEPAES